MSVLLGDVAPGSNGNDFEGAGVCFGTRLDARVTGVVDTISLKVTAANLATSVLAAVFTDSAGTPGTKIGSSVTITLTASTAGTFTSAAGAGAQVFAGGSYWIVILSPTGGATVTFSTTRGTGGAGGPAGGSKDTPAGNATIPATWPGTSGTFAETTALIGEGVGVEPRPDALAPAALGGGDPNQYIESPEGVYAPPGYFESLLDRQPSGVYCRRFDGAAAFLDFPLPTLMGGAATYAALVRTRSRVNVSGVVTQNTSTDGIMGGLLAGETSPLGMSYINHSSSTDAGGALKLYEDWSIVVVTKTAGTTTPRFHRWTATATGASAWTHQDGLGTIANPTLGTAGKITVGSFQKQASPNRFFDGDVAVVGVWNAALSDAEVEGLSALEKTQDWKATQSAALQLLVDLNQQTVSSVADLSGNARNQSAEASTAVNNDGPGFWTFGISGGNSFVRACTDSVALSEALAVASGFVRSPADAITLTESVARAAAHPRSTSDALTLSESLAGISAHPRTLADSTTLSESVAKSVTLSRATTDAATLSESVARVVGRPRAVADSVSLADVLASSAGKSRAVADAVTLSESLARAALAFVRPVSDSLTIAEAVARSAAYPRAVADSLTLAESLASQAGKARAVADSATLSESLARGAMSFVRRPLNNYSSTIAARSGITGYWRLGETSGTNANDEIGTNDGTLQSGASFGGAGALIGDTDGAGIFNGTANGFVLFGASGLTGDFSLEAWVFLTGAGSVGSNTNSTIFGISGTRRLLINNVNGYVLAQLGPNLQTADGSLTLNAWHHVVYVFDGVSTQRIYIDGREAAVGGGAGASSFAGTFFVGSYTNPGANYMFLGRIDEPATYNRALSAAEAAEGWSRGFGPDGVLTSESVARVGAYPRAVADSATFAESLAAQAGKTRGVADSLALAEALARSVTVTRTASDAVTLADAIAQTIGRPRAVTDSITLAEVLASSAGKTRTVADAITLADALTRAAMSFTRSRTDALTLSDATARTLVIARAAVDAITLSESLASSAGKTRLASDAVTLADAAVRSAMSMLRPVTQTLTLSESLARVLGVSRSTADAILLSESVVRSKGVARPLVDALTLTESLTKVNGKSRSVIDQLTLAEVLAYVLSNVAISPYGSPEAEGRASGVGAGGRAGAIEGDGSGSGIGAGGLVSGLS